MAYLRTGRAQVRRGGRFAGGCYFCGRGPVVRHGRCVGCEAERQERVSQSDDLPPRLEYDLAPEVRHNRLLRLVPDQP